MKLSERAESIISSLLSVAEDARKRSWGRPSNEPWKYIEQAAAEMRPIADEIAALEGRAGVTLSEEAAIKRAIRVLTLVDTPVHEADQEDHAAADALCALLERTKAEGAARVEGERPGLCATPDAAPDAPPKQVEMARCECGNPSHQHDIIHICCDCGSYLP